MLEIDAKLFLSFLDKLTLKGNVTSCIIETNAQEMFSRVMTQDNIIYVKARLGKKAFFCYKEGLRISLGQVEGNSLVTTLRKTIATYSGNIKVVVKENRIIIECENDSMSATLTAEEFVSEHAKEPNLKFDGGVVFELTTLKKIIKNIKTLSSIDGTPSVLLTVKKGICNFTVNVGETKLMHQEKVKYKDCTVRISGEYFTNIVSVLDEKTNLSFETDFPIRFKEKIEYLTVEYICAPRVSSDEETEKEGKEKTTTKKKKTTPAKEVV